MAGRRIDHGLSRRTCSECHRRVRVTIESTSRYCVPCAAGITPSDRKRSHFLSLLHRVDKIREDCIERVMNEGELIDPFVIDRDHMRAVEKLRSVYVVFTGSRSCAGVAYQMRGRISLSRPFFSNPINTIPGNLMGFDGTVRHELAHMIQFQNSSAHGKIWRHCALALGDSGERAHSMMTKYRMGICVICQERAPISERTGIGMHRCGEDRERGRLIPEFIFEQGSVQVDDYIQVMTKSAAQRKR